MYTYFYVKLSSQREMMRDCADYPSLFHSLRWDYCHLCLPSMGLSYSCTVCSIFCCLCFSLMQLYLYSVLGVFICLFLSYHILYV